MGLAFAFVIAAAATAAAPAVRHRVEADAALTSLRVETCTRDGASRLEFVRGREANAAAITEVTRSSGAAIDRWSARDWQPGECLRYRVVIDALLAGARGEDLGRIGDAITLPPAMWLYRPRMADANATIEVVLPDGVEVTTPWSPIGANTFRLGATPPAWPTLFAIGRFPRRSVSGLRVAFLGDIDASEVETLAAFVEHTSRDLLGTFPQGFASKPQVVLLATGRRGGDAIPFGQSYRGGGDALVLYVDPSRRLDDYLDEWTATHELVHLVHPYLGDDGRWISEGIATYYQNVLRARGGRIGAAKAWDNLRAGFERGRRANADMTIGETSRRGRNYMRIYWSGTALALAADVAWRTREANPTSLDAVLGAYRRTSARVDPGTFVDALDAIAGGEPVFGPLYRRYVGSTAFPEPPEVSAKLRREIMRAAD